jgi:hypothetical protein
VSEHGSALSGNSVGGEHEMENLFFDDCDQLVSGASDPDSAICAGANQILWQKNGHPQLADLGTLGGDNASALWLNDAEEVIGYADLPPNPSGCTGLSVNITRFCGGMAR